MEDVAQVARVVDVGMPQIRHAWEIAARYRYGHYDSLIVATAISAGVWRSCTALQREAQLAGMRSKRAIDSTCEVCGNILTTPAPRNR